MGDETKKGIDQQVSDPKEPSPKNPNTEDPGHFGNQSRPPRQLRKPDLEERHQREKAQAPDGEPRTTDGTGTAIPGKKRLREVLR